MTAESEALDRINDTLEDVLGVLSGILVQFTSVNNAFRLEDPQTLGQNIQDLRDDTREGVERGQELLRKQGL